MLTILDGFGLGEKNEGNAIALSGAKNIFGLAKEYPSAKLGASGLDVGLPDGQMGNSEVGHLNIGAGRIVYQELTRITKSIEDKDFFENAEFVTAISNAKKNGGKLHLYGLLSDGGVHSHIDHLLALIKLAKQSGLDNVYVHAFLDGRDVSPTSGSSFIKQVYDFMAKENFGKIATVCGRYFAMDRDNRWDRVEKAYNLLTKGEGEKVTCPYEAVEKSYKEGTTDEFMAPMAVVNENGEITAKIESGDSIICFNFRPDRAREITRTFIDENFDGFKREKLDVTYVCFTRYDDSFQNVLVAFKPQTLINTLGEFLANNNKTQLRIAETEKYAHVTFFFNGGVETPNENEIRELIPSPKVATYDLKPEMSALEVCEKVIENIRAEKFDTIILNFANCDMVGHTGVIPASIKAVDTVDTCVKQIAEEVLKVGGHMLITADHGNADKLLEDDGSPFTAHTTNPVPFILVSEKYKNAKLNDGILADVAPTILDLMGLKKPEEMTGKSLIELK